MHKLHAHVTYTCHTHVTYNAHAHAHVHTTFHMCMCMSHVHVTCACTCTCTCTCACACACDMCMCMCIVACSCSCMHVACAWMHVACARACACQRTHAHEPCTQHMHMPRATCTQMCVISSRAHKCVSSGLKGCCDSMFTSITTHVQAHVDTTRV